MTNDPTSVPAETTALSMAEIHRADFERTARARERRLAHAPTERQREVLQRMVDYGFPEGVNYRGVWSFRYSDEAVTAEVKALERKGLIAVTRLGIRQGAAMSITEAGHAALGVAE